jgi:hypothetical protein
VLAAALFAWILAPAPDASHVLAGELAHVGTAGVVVVKEAGPPPREIRVRTDAATVVTSRGRALAVADLRPGDRIIVLCADAAGVHRARRIKASPQGANRNATR